MLNNNIIYEDDDIVVICKPPFIVSVRASTVNEETIQDWFEKRLGDIGKYEDSKDEMERYFFERKGIVHRLDKETTGVMILAKNPQAFSSLLSQFKRRDVKKKYIALTHGIWKASEGNIVLPLARMRHNRKKFGVDIEGKSSRTDYIVLKRFRSWNFPDKVDDSGYQGFSLVEFMPRSGRTHQIRVHARHIGHPIVGDYLYSGKKRTRVDREWVRRTLLHASKITFFHPRTDNKLEFECHSEDLRDILLKHFNFKLKD